MLNGIVFDVVVIGAGPSGTVCANLLKQRGLNVIIIEAQSFPRFVIGESLLPQCNEILEEANLLDAVKASADKLGFQYKNGAMFEFGGKFTTIDFRKKFSEGAGETWQVRRADFDKLLADQTEENGIDIYYQHKVVGYNRTNGITTLDVTNNEDESLQVKSRFVVDGSGYGRVLPKLLELDRPSDFPVRKACFTHIEDRIDNADYDRSKILITVHPHKRDVWFWTIPFSDGRCSIGVVGEPSSLSEGEAEDILKTAVSQVPHLTKLLSSAKWDTPVNSIMGYSSKVSTLSGDGFCLLGNAGEFLDPVFSSGVTIAMQSARLAAPCIEQTLNGKPVDWQTEYEEALLEGVNTFKTYVQGWYDLRFQDVIFMANRNERITSMISSVLAGYAWDKENPFVKNSDRKLNALVGYTQID